MICIIINIYGVSTNTIKCKILIKVLWICTLDYMHTFYILPLYNTISNYHNFKSFIKAVAFNYFLLNLWYFDELFCNHQLAIILTIRLLNKHNSKSAESLFTWYKGLQQFTEYIDIWKCSFHIAAIPF